ncbi:MAG: hypothetical protein ACRECV_10335 [Xanthobacteraceae bacterium]
MATPELTITATLSSAPVSKAGELQQLNDLINLAVNAARGAGGASTSGTVEGAFGIGSANWTYTPNASS